MSDFDKKRASKNILIVLTICIVTILIFNIIGNMMSGTTRNYSDILNKFKKQEVVEYNLNLGSGDMDLKLKSGETIHYVAPSVHLMLKDIKDYVQEYDKDHPNAPMVYNLVRASEVSSFIVNNLLSAVIPMLILGVLTWFLLRKVTIIGGDRTGTFPFGKPKIKNLGETSKVKFDSVAGVEEEKEELTEVVDFLKFPKKYTELGARIPRGVLLVGPPGTGKTLLAKAVAGEAGVPFYSMSGSDFVEMYVGVGASRVRELFSQAKKTTPCVIFIDEIDAVGRKRGSGISGHDEREQTLNQLLVEMDGFETNEGIIVIAATNRSDILDHALTRPGRFDRSVFVGYPDVKGREDILRIHAKGKPFAPGVTLKDVAKTTAGFTGADLENLLNESALLAARKDKKLITQDELDDATIKVIMGTEKKSHVITDEEKRITAYHETGHALVTHFCPTQDPVHQISIIPRGAAGGYTMSLPEKNHMYVSKTKMQEEISTLLAGQIAENIIFNDISTGASSDLKRATSLARDMVVKYGMSTEIGPIVCDTSNNSFIESSTVYSDELVQKIDNEVSNFIRLAYDKAKKILEDHISDLHKVAESLISNEKLTGDEFRALLTE